MTAFVSLQESSIIDLWLSAKYASDISNKTFFFSYLLFPSFFISKNIFAKDSFCFNVCLSTGAHSVGVVNQCIIDGKKARFFEQKEPNWTNNKNIEAISCTTTVK